MAPPSQRRVRRVRAVLLCRLMMADPPDGYVSSADACKALGISDRTLRRRVQAGTLAGEYIARPQGSVLYVKLPDGYAAPQAAPPPADREMQENAGGNRENQAAGHAAIVTALLERLDGKDAALLAATERAARAEAERDAARQAAKAARTEATDLRERLARRRWYRWW